MIKLKRIFTATILFISSLGVFAQNFPPPGPGDQQFPNPPEQQNIPPNRPEPPERPKKRFPLERQPTEPFIPVFVKNFEENGYLYVEIVFNSAVNMGSFIEALIFINGQPIDKTCILFSRDGHRCKCRVFADKEDSIKIKMAGVMSWDGLFIPPMEIINIDKNSTYGFNKESNQWQKFSL